MVGRYGGAVGSYGRRSRIGGISGDCTGGLEVSVSLNVNVFIMARAILLRVGECGVVQSSEVVEPWKLRSKLGPGRRTARALASLKLKKVEQIHSCCQRRFLSTCSWNALFPPAVI